MHRHVGRMAPGFLLALSWLLLGCSGAERRAEPAGDAPPRPKGLEVRCYQGRGEVVLAEGQKAPAGEKVLRRTVDPLNSRILEEVLEADPSGARPPQLWFVRQNLEQNPNPVPAAREANLRCAWFFRAKEAQDLFEGLGCLEGPAWAWTAWDATYLFFNRVKVVMRSRLVPEGLQISQEVWSDMDQLEARIEELLLPVEPEICAQRLPQPP